MGKSMHLLADDGDTDSSSGEANLAVKFVTNTVMNLMPEEEAMEKPTQRKCKEQKKIMVLAGKTL